MPSAAPLAGPFHKMSVVSSIAISLRIAQIKESTFSSCSMDCLEEGRTWLNNEISQQLLNENVPENGNFESMSESSDSDE